jgi:threonine dehydratase
MARAPHVGDSAHRELNPPTLDDVVDARGVVDAHLARTPLVGNAALGRLLGADVWVKQENHQPGGAFKVRGGINLVSRLSDDERRRGIIGASTGNHGLSLAFAAARFGVPARICVPKGANPGKVAAIGDLGCEVIEHGVDYDEAREHCEELATERG